MVTDMTVGSPAKILLKFSLPMLGSVAFQQLYSIVDSVIAGNCINADALAAVGASYPVTMIFMAFATGGSIGATVVVSMLFGGKRMGELKTAISTAICTFAVVSILLTILGVIFCNPIMQLLNTPQNIFDDSATYLQIYVFGLAFLFLYNACNGIFTALGDSKTPFIFLIGSSLGNIVLDLLLVIVFKMGVAGVAWATFIAQGIACVLALATLAYRIKKLNITEKSHRFSIPMLKQISRISIPSILQSSFVSVGNLFIQGLVNSFGSDVVAGYSAAVKLNTFALTCFGTMSNGISTYVAQNMGAGKRERIHKGVKVGLLISLAVSVPFIAAYVIFGQNLVGLFAKEPTQQILETGKWFLVIIAPFYSLIGIKITLDGALRGAGVMKAFMISTFTDLILRVVFAYILSPFFDSTGIWMSWPIGWVLAMFISIFFYRKMTKSHAEGIF